LCVNSPRLNGHCRLKGALKQAPDSDILAVLDGVTLADLLEPMPPPGAGARKVVRVKHIPGLPGL
jgi:Rrf2 family nitric oxide-sensitive transcriptional repressor